MMRKREREKQRQQEMEEGQLHVKVESVPRHRLLITGASDERRNQINDR
jgi:hypothetical protein